MIKIIAAIDENKVIWKDLKLPWYVKEDLEFFQNTIRWKIVIMWKNTYLSLKKYYPNFEWHPLAWKNIILSKSLSNINWAEVYNNKEEILRRYLNEEIFIIWWWEVYKEFLDIADELIITKIPWIYEWDTYFPEYEEKFLLISKKSLNNEWVFYENRLKM